MRAPLGRHTPYCIATLNPPSTLNPGTRLEVTAVAVIHNDGSHIAAVQQIVDTQECVDLEPVQLDSVAAVQPCHAYAGANTLLTSFTATFETY